MIFNRCAYIISTLSLFRPGKAVSSLQSSYLKSAWFWVVGSHRKVKFFSEHKTSFLLPDSSTPDTWIFFKPYKEKKGKKTFNLAYENAVKMSNNNWFPPCSLKKKDKITSLNYNISSTTINM